MCNVWHRLAWARVVQWPAPTPSRHTHTHMCVHKPRMHVKLDTHTIGKSARTRAASGRTHTLRHTYTTSHPRLLHMAKMLTLVIKHRTCPGWFSPNEPERAARWGRENDVSRGHMASSMCCIIRKSLRVDVCVCVCGTASLVVVVVALVTRGRVVADFHFANVCQSRPKSHPTHLSTPPKRGPFVVLLYVMAI